MITQLEALMTHQENMKACKRCPEMIGPVIAGKPGLSGIIIVGQAPGPREGEIGRPFGWTAGKQLFKWFAEIGVEEEHFREHVYIAAVGRCFPGKNPKGGDRVPNKQEIAQCAPWLEAEISIIQPQLLIPIGKLAISQYLPVAKLTDVIGQQFRQSVAGREVDIIPLPHPSGLSTWHRGEPGKTLLKEALNLIEKHIAWQKLQQL